MYMHVHVIQPHKWIYAFGRYKILQLKSSNIHVQYMCNVHTCAHRHARSPMLNMLMCTHTHTPLSCWFPVPCSWSVLLPVVPGRWTPASLKIPEWPQVHQCEHSTGLSPSLARAVWVRRDKIPYSGKLSRVKMFTNFAVWEPPVNVFSTKFWVCHTHPWLV